MWHNNMLILVVFSACLVGVLSDGCGKDFPANVTSGAFNADFPPKINDSCTWTITASMNVTKQVSLMFSNLKINATIFDLKVFSKPASGNNTPIVDLGANQDVGIVISTEAVTSVVLTRKTEGAITGNSFNASFDSTVCNKEMKSTKGTLSPKVAYVVGTKVVKCNFTMTKSDGDLYLLMFTKYTLSKDSWMSVTFGTEVAVNVTGPALPDDLIGTAPQDSVQVVVSYNTSGANQDFSVIYETVCGQCSGQKKAGDDIATIVYPVTKFPMSCYAQITSTDAKASVFVYDNSTQVNAGVDSITYYDGSSQRAPVLGSSNSGSSVVLTSQQKMTVVANLGVDLNRNRILQYKQDTQSKLVALGNKSETIEVTGKQDKVYLKFTAQKPVIQISLEATFASESTLTIAVQDKTGTALYTFSNSTRLFPVNVKGGPVVVLLSSLKDNKETVKVTAAALDAEDCNVLYNGLSGTLSFPALDKPGTCALYINTATTSMLELSKVTQCATSTLEIFSGLGTTDTKLATITGAGTSNIPRFFIIDNGIRIFWNDTSAAKSCSAPKLSGRYWNQNKDAACNPVKVGADGRSLVQTPNFPNNYPLSLQCQWKLDALPKNKTIHVSADALNLAGSDSVTLMKADKKFKTFTGNGTVMPADLLVPVGTDSLTMTFNTALKADSLSQTAPGAQISYKVIDLGKTLKDANGTVVSQPKTTSAYEAFWFITVPQAGNASTVTVVRIKDYSVQGTKGKGNALIIHDGNSTRAPEIPMKKNRTLSQNISTTATVVLHYVYTGGSNGAPLNFTLNYESYVCVNVCRNGKCMKPDWVCNGVNDCGDWSDELQDFCKGHYSPTPPPTTTSPQPVTKASTGKTGASGGWLFFCIVVGIVLGVILTLALPRVVRCIRRRNNRSGRSGYDTMHEDA